MARMSKRISNKINEKKAQESPQQEKKKAGKDIWLIVLICINFVLLVTGWQELIKTPASFATYVLLQIVLVIMYVNRHAKLSEIAAKWLFRVQICLMGMILALFLYNIYSYFIA